MAVFLLSINNFAPIFFSEQSTRESVSRNWMQSAAWLIGNYLSRFSEQVTAQILQRCAVVCQQRMHPVCRQYTAINIRNGRLKQLKKNATTLELHQESMLGVHTCELFYIMYRATTLMMWLISKLETLLQIQSVMISATDKRVKKYISQSQYNCSMW